MAMTVLGLAGSARRGGNTEIMLDWCLGAAREAGATVVKFSLCDLDLHGCKACDACFKDGVCIQKKDDMKLLYPHLRSADSIVLAAPSGLSSICSRNRSGPRGAPDGLAPS